MSHFRLTTLVLLAGCPYLGESGYTDRVRDLDGDGFVAERFGGPDCADDNPAIGDCDADGDGVRTTAAGGTDCDDSRADVHPDAPELCNGRDDDCDGLVDANDTLAEGSPTVYADRDGDGYGDPDAMLPWCEPDAPPRGYTNLLDATDCDDTNGEVNPAADELCDNVDHDCDGDPILGAVGASLWFEDTDGDGFGDGDAKAVSCEDPGGGLVSAAGDCAPTDGSVHPEALDVPYDGIDQDCDGADVTDVDGDGVDGGPEGTDCDDTRPGVRPGAVEVCNGIDDNCDGQADEGQLIDFYPDTDGDLQGDASVDALSACIAPAGHVSNNRDCDDSLPTVRDGGVERCNGIDDDCDGVIDDSAVDRVTRYRDADGDLYGDPSQQVSVCEANLDPRFNWVSNDDDCDDSWAFAHPGGVEICDDHDNDCNGGIDDNVGSTFYVDGDGDGWGNASQPVRACSASDGELSTVPGDCNDADGDTYPGAPELCGDDFRQDCSTLSPFDCDDDGYIDVASGGDDCDDTQPNANPGAIEVCDGLDNDCDGLFDDEDDSVDITSIADWYLDADEDGYADDLAPLVAAQACAPIPGAAIRFGDCDDGDPAINPQGVERCNGLDDDCDGEPDDVAEELRTPWYRDVDRDGYGTGAVLLRQCDDPGLGYARTATDCQDTNPAIHPELADTCNGLDDDCDGLVDGDDPGATLDAWYVDSDGDGYGYTGSAVYTCNPAPGLVALGGDCDDTRASKSPAAIEICDGGIDNNCDGLADDNDPTLTDSTSWGRDADNDGWAMFDPQGDDLRNSCIKPAGFALIVDGKSDCNDALPGIHPGAFEICDNDIDNDCDGLADDRDDNLVFAPAWFPDVDNDGWGDEDGEPTYSCLRPISGNFAVFDGDCDDNDKNVNPLAVETCLAGDQDCDGLVDAADPDGQIDLWYADLDADGFGGGTPLRSCSDPLNGSIPLGGDCEDDPTAEPLAAQINPSAVERCNDLDDDCDNVVDESSAVDAVLFWVDADGDGYGKAGSTASRYCPNHEAAGTVNNASDCNDASDLINPDALESCADTVDQNCDGQILGPDAVVYYFDPDGDDYVDGLTSITSCSSPLPVTQWTKSPLVGTDCGPFDGTIYPGAPELCDNKLNDCDSTSLADEENAFYGPWYIDGDNDGFGDPNDPGPVLSCFQVPGHSDNALDCRDDLASVNPNVPVEFCDDLDNDCDGLFDDDDTDTPIAGQVEIFLDADRDGWGVRVADASFQSCPTKVPSGFATLAGDCDESRGDINPSAQEVCDDDFIDEDCDGYADDDDNSAQGRSPWYIDVDGDGVGFNSTPFLACHQPDQFVATNTDCNDSNPLFTAAVPTSIDVDGDGWGDADGTLTGAQCTAAPNMGPALDCNDLDANIMPYTTAAANNADLQFWLDQVCVAGVIKLSDNVNFDSIIWPQDAEITLVGENFEASGQLLLDTTPPGTRLENLTWALDDGEIGVSLVNGGFGRLDSIQFIGVNAATAATAIAVEAAELSFNDIECTGLEGNIDGSCMFIESSVVVGDNLNVDSAGKVAVVIKGSDIALTDIIAENGSPTRPVVVVDGASGFITGLDAREQAAIEFQSTSGLFKLSDVAATAFLGTNVTVPGVGINGGSVEINNAIIFGLSAPGITVAPGSTATIRHATVLGNQKALAVDMANIVVRFSVFADNGGDMPNGTFPSGCTSSFSIFEDRTDCDSATSGVGLPEFMTYQPLYGLLVPFPKVGGNLYDVSSTELDVDGTDADIGFTGGPMSDFVPYATYDDLLPDSWEDQFPGTVELSTFGDADGDGLSDYDEYLLGTHPRVSDTDGDLIRDGDESPPSCALNGAC